MFHNSVVLVDGNNLAFRNYHTRMLTTSDGVNTGVLYGVLQSTKDILSKRGEDTKIIYFWENGANDPDGIKPWRRNLTGGKVYKANRKADEASAEVKKQIKLVIPILQALGYGQILVPGLEADDMIGIVSAKLAKRSNVGTVYIYSTDRDFFQCIDGDRVFVMRPEGKGNERSIRTIKPSSVVKEFGVTPEQWAAYKALVGDPSDNYKGLPGCGPVSALTYLREGLDPSLPTFAEQSKHIKKQYPALRSHWQEIYSSYQLAYIPRIPDYPLFPKQAQKLAKEVVLESPRMLVRRMTREHMKTALALFTTFCADYELNSFIAERRNFFSTVEVIDESQEKEVQPQRHSACTKRMGLQRDNCPARSS